MGREEEVMFVTDVRVLLPVQTPTVKYKRATELAAMEMARPPAARTDPTAPGRGGVTICMSNHCCQILDPHTLKCRSGFSSESSFGSKG